MVKGPRAPQTGSTSRRGEPVFYVFDLLWLGGEDRRSRPLIERKRLLRPILPEQPSVMLCAEHIERTGMEFFRVGCEQDLEGIVAKAKHGAYGEKWFKIRNPRYSQYEGRRGLFESRRHIGAGEAGFPLIGLTTTRWALDSW